VKSERVKVVSEKFFARAFDFFGNLEKREASTERPLTRARFQLDAITGVLEILFSPENISKLSRCPLTISPSQQQIDISLRVL
jgi:hypothetical protein